MKKLKFSLILILLVCLLCGSAYAADNSTVDAVQSIESDNNTQVLEISDDNLLSAGEGSFSDLQLEIGSSNSVELNKDYKYSSSDNSPIIISNTKTIDGKGYTIDADGKNRIFFIESESTVVLKNIILLLNIFELTKFIVQNSL